MNRGVRILLAGAVLAVAAYWVSYELTTRPTKAMLACHDSGMEWLRGEYHLTDAQFSRIQKLHEEYRPGCDARCRGIAEANTKLRALIDSNHSVTPEMAATLNEWTSLEGECRKALLGHVYAVSAEMNPEDGRRYLKMAVASILGAGQEHTQMMDRH